MSKKQFKYIFYLLLISGLFIIVFQNVSKEIHKEDIEYIEKYLQTAEINSSKLPERFDQQIELIRKVQQSVLKISPVGEGIPINLERRPKDLYNFGKGLCYDRSFVLEMIFRYLGFETRHVSLFKNFPNQGTLSELTTREIPSHAISEVKTARGWMLVDSNAPWLGLDSLGKTYSMKDIRKANGPIGWIADEPNELYKENNHFIYGLYSRHGRFFKPFNSIPDYNLRELLYNF